MSIYPKSHDFCDLDEVMMNILCLRLPDGPGRYVGADRRLKRDLKSSGSNFTSKTVLQDSYWEFNLSPNQQMG